MLYFGLAVFAVLLTPARRHLTHWPWLGGAIALLFLLPYVFWEVPTAGPRSSSGRGYGEKVDEASPLEFLIEQIVTMQPPTLPLWLAGSTLPFSRDGRPYRALGWSTFVLFVLSGTERRFYFLAPAYPMLFAAGAVVLERFVARRNWNWIKPAYVAVLVVSGIIVAPITVLPVLPVETLARITGAAGGTPGCRSRLARSDSFPRTSPTGSAGRTSSRPWTGSTRSFPRRREKQRASSPATTGGGRYRLLRAEHGLPGAISGHNSYYIWGPGDCTGESS